MTDSPLVRVTAPSGVDECWVLGHFSHDDPTRTELAKLFSEVRYDPDVAPELGELLVESVVATETSIGAVDRVVALPSSRDLPSILAAALAEHLRLAAPAGDELWWNRPIGPMKDVPLEERPTYAAGAMSARRMPGATVVLIDDATRSGSTFSEAARAVRDAGAERVVCVALVAIEG